MDIILASTPQQCTNQVQNHHFARQIGDTYLSKKSRSACLLFVASLCSISRSVAQQAPRGSITIDRIADIKYPSEQRWSPDGKTVAFLWDAAGKQDLFNIANSNTVISEVPVGGSSFRQPTNQLNPFIARFGLRFSF